MITLPTLFTMMHGTNIIIKEVVRHGVPMAGATLELIELLKVKTSTKALCRHDCEKHQFMMMLSTICVMTHGMNIITKEVVRRGIPMVSATLELIELIEVEVLNKSTL